MPPGYGGGCAPSRGPSTGAPAPGPVRLELFREKVRAARLADVEVIRAGFLSYAHEGRPADMVYTRFALHHLPDPWKAIALDRIRGILRPGGFLRLWDVVYDFEPRQADERLEAWCAAYDEAADGEWNRADVEEHIRDEHSTFTWMLEPMIERCGFAIEEAEHVADGLFARYVARAR